jgi:hypothetical protein
VVPAQPGVEGPRLEEDQQHALHDLLAPVVQPQMVEQEVALPTTANSQTEYNHSKTEPMECGRPSQVREQGSTLAIAQSQAECSTR